MRKFVASFPSCFLYILKEICYYISYIVCMIGNLIFHAVVLVNNFNGCLTDNHIYLKFANTIYRHLFCNFLPLNQKVREAIKDERTHYGAVDKS